MNLAINKVLLFMVLVPLFARPIMAEEGLATWGREVADKDRASLEALRHKAESGDAESQFYLAKMYAGGGRVPTDRQEFLRWMQKAADGGFPRAQFVIGDLYNTGSDFTNDYDQAEKWLAKAAVQGDLEAEVELADLYADGSRFQKPNDFLKASIWYRKAAEQDTDKNSYTVYQSARSLGFIYAQDNGVPQDWKEAYFWSCVATRCFEKKTVTKPNNGIVSAWSSDSSIWENSDPDEGKSHLTRAEITEVQMRAAKWKHSSKVP